MRAATAALALVSLALSPQAALRLGPALPVAPGIDLFHVGQTDLLDPPGPIAVQLLRLDPRRVRLAAVLARDHVLGAETVPSMARRLGAFAAVNAGFFLPTGEPAGLMKVAGTLVSDAPLQRGAVAISAPAGGTGVALAFDQVRASIVLGIRTRAGEFRVPASGVDTVRPRGRLVWFDALFNSHTDTTDAGTEWVVAGSPPAVTERRARAMRTVIPSTGGVLSFGGDSPAPPLDRLDIRDPVRIDAIYETARGTSPAVWERARDAVGGAGLLMYQGEPVREWSVERLRPGFTTERHPRTMIGVDEHGSIWLVTVDGRSPLLSLGMTFAELQALALGLHLRDALNLDGGGSTTMVVRNVVVNHPSDATGPRSVSDAILVFPIRR
jgi:hypothetical protein